jgi:hypothetical protein
MKKATGSMPKSKAKRWPLSEKKKPLIKSRRLSIWGPQTALHTTQTYFCVFPYITGFTREYYYLSPISSFDSCPPL